MSFSHPLCNIPITRMHLEIDSHYVLVYYMLAFLKRNLYGVKHESYLCVKSLGSPNHSCQRCFMASLNQLRCPLMQMEKISRIWHEIRLISHISVFLLLCSTSGTQLSLIQQSILSSEHAFRKQSILSSDWTYCLLPVSGQHTLVLPFSPPL